MSDNGVPMEQIKSAMRATWMAGDFGMVAKTIAAPADGFVSQLPVTSGIRALDVATGTGNVALPLARRGAVVTGLDLVPDLLRQARERAAAEGLQIQFDEGDAEAMPYADASFDLVTTMFGAMFAPRPALVAAELARVLKAGGTLAMGNWNPASFTGKMFRVGAKHVPPPPGIAPPVLWGDPATVTERLFPYFTHIETAIQPIEFHFSDSPAAAVAFFREYFGPTKMAFSRLDAAGQAALQADLEALWAGENVSDDPEHRTLINNEYLLVKATRS